MTTEALHADQWPPITRHQPLANGRPPVHEPSKPRAEQSWTCAGIRSDARTKRSEKEQQQEQQQQQQPQARNPSHSRDGELVVRTLGGGLAAQRAATFAPRVETAAHPFSRAMQGFPHLTVDADGSLVTYWGHRYAPMPLGFCGNASAASVDCGHGTCANATTHCVCHDGFSWEIGQTIQPVCTQPEHVLLAMLCLFTALCFGNVALGVSYLWRARGEARRGDNGPHRTASKGQRPRKFTIEQKILLVCIGLNLFTPCMFLAHYLERIHGPLTSMCHIIIIIVCFHVAERAIITFVSPLEFLWARAVEERQARQKSHVWHPRTVAYTLLGIYVALYLAIWSTAFVLSDMGLFNTLASVYTIIMAVFTSALMSVGFVWSRRLEDALHRIAFSARQQVTVDQAAAGRATVRSAQTANDARVEVFMERINHQRVLAIAVIGSCAFALAPPVIIIASGTFPYHTVTVYLLTMLLFPVCTMVVIWYAGSAGSAGAGRLRSHRNDADSYAAHMQEKHGSKVFTGSVIMSADGESHAVSTFAGASTADSAPVAGDRGIVQGGVHALGEAPHVAVVDKEAGC